MSRNSLFGMSGHFAVLSLFLRRGYNVAIPVVDTGDDAILIDDREHALRRLQVKSGNPGKLTIKFSRVPATSQENATLWDRTLDEHLNRWPAEWPDRPQDRASPPTGAHARRRTPP